MCLRVRLPASQATRTTRWCAGAASLPLPLVWQLRAASRAGDLCSVRRAGKASRCCTTRNAPGRGRLRLRALLPLLAWVQVLVQGLVLASNLCQAPLMLLLPLPCLWLPAPLPLALVLVPTVAPHTALLVKLAVAQVMVVRGR